MGDKLLICNMCRVKGLRPPRQGCAGCLRKQQALSQIVCGRCSKVALVPFTPEEGRAVYCWPCKKLIDLEPPKPPKPPKPPVTDESLFSAACTNVKQIKRS